MEEKKTLMERLDVALSKVKTFLSTEEDAPVKLAAEVVKEDGTVVYTDADEFAPGVSVFVKDGEEVVPAPDGEHKLEDGRVVIVSEGVVESISEAEVEEEMSDEPEFATKAEMNAKFNEFANILADALNLSIEMSKESDAAKEKAAELEAKLSKAEEEKANLETQLNAQPAASSVKNETKERKELTLSEQEINNLSTKEYIKLTREFPELLKK